MLFKRVGTLFLGNKIPIDISEIKHHIYAFYRHININQKNNTYEKAMSILLDARLHLDSARMILRTMIQPETSKEYLKGLGEAYTYMAENLGRFDRRLDDMERPMKVRGDERSYLKNYTREIILGMENLVIYPLQSAWEKFILIDEDSRGRKIVKDADLFLYYVFLYLFHSSTTLGVWTRDDKQKQTEIIKENIPTEHPKGMKTEPVVSQELIQEINEETLFSGNENEL